MKKNVHITNIGRVKINNISKGVSINFGPSIHKGYQANSKINTGEIAIGDSFTFGCPENGNEENEENGKHYV